MTRLKAGTLAAGALLLLSGASARAAGVTGDAGAMVTEGSDGYHRLDFLGDVDWKRGDLSPYAWGDYAVDNDVRQFGAGAGAWKDLSADWSVKGGLGGYTGSLRGTGQTGGSFLLETGLERSIGRGAAGIDYRFTDGMIGGPAIPVRYGDALRGRGQARAALGATPSLPSYTYSDAALYARVPLGSTKLGLRAGYELPSYSSSIRYEEVSLKIPVAEVVRVKPAVTFTQGAVNAVYGSILGEILF